MDKRICLSPPNQNHKGATYDLGEDRISQLPEEILVSILSEIPLKEAARTSVLSHRWKTLWTLTTHLIFDGSKTKWDIKCSLKLLKEERYEFITIVDHAVDSYKGPNLDDFVVCFDLGSRFSTLLDKWINFALTKKVKRLEIDLTPFIIRNRMEPKLYDFPADFHCLPNRLSSITFLKSLCLKYVNIKGEVIEHFLSNCPLLEQLCVHSSEHLLDLEVVGSSLRLNFLEIKACSNLKRLKISVPNLVSFSYGGQKISFQIQNLPSLVHLSIGASYGYYIDCAFRKFSRYFSQLETLTFDIHLHKENMNFRKLPQLTKLRHLTVKVTVSEYDYLLGLSELIKLSPFLHKFTLELLWLGCTIPRKLNTDIKCPHQYLKVVEFKGFVGQSGDIELVKFFIENAIMLEKIIIDFQSPPMMKRPKEFEKFEWKPGARRRAELLRAELPPGVELLVL